MKQKYCIIEMGRMGKYINFEDALLVVVVRTNELKEYYNLDEYAPNYEEQMHNMQSWLVFKNYPGKMEWLEKKEAMCENGKYWEIDLDDFICRPTTITKKRTGEAFMRPLHQVIMVNERLDVVEAKEQGLTLNYRNGAQKILDELGLKLVGKSDKKYYIVSSLEGSKAYAIPYDVSNNDGGMYQIDLIVLGFDTDAESSISVVKVEKEEWGVFNYLTRQLFGFAD